MADRTKKRANNKNNKIKKYRKPLNLNIGMIIFSVIFLYVIVCVIIYLQTSHIVRYEVQEGSLSTNNLYRGVVIRDETVVRTTSTGYVNYCAREGERVAKNDLVYVVDETGQLSQQLESLNLGENTLSKKSLAEFRSELVTFSHDFDRVNYDAVYDFKYSLKNTVLKLANENILNSINKLGAVNAVNYSYAPKTGVVAYWTDGFENLRAQDVTEDIFENEKTTYKKKQNISNTLLEAGDAVYKLSADEDWSIVIPIDTERGAKLQEEEYIKVRFLKNQYESWGQAKLLVNRDGKSYLQLSFTNSMITFLPDRFLDVELIVENELGLKIPLSSIVQKEFFLIPDDFVIQGGTNGGDSIVRQCYLEDGTISSEIIETSVYNFDSETKEYYVDSAMLNPGDILYKLNSQETYTVSRRATLVGVYNMNKGYADFKQINILYQNDEYAIVKSNTRYGLSVYDYIVLNADSVKDDQLIN